MERDITRAKFAYINYDEIEPLISSGKLDAFDIVYTKDTHENIIIAPDLSLAPVKSKVCRFNDTASAELALNGSTGTYEGQIVSILTKDAYTAYVVNRDKGGRFYVSPLDASSGEVNYDTLGRRPITNLEGSLDSPITVSSLDDGIYKIKGQYKVAPGAATTYLSANSNLFLVGHDAGDGTVSIKKISASDMADFSVSPEGNVSEYHVPTERFLEEKGYATEGYVDAKLAALDCMTKEEASQYIEDTIMQFLDVNLGTMVDEKIGEKLAPSTQPEIEAMWKDFK